MTDLFDQNDPANLGRPLYFKLDKFIETVEMLIRSDELQTALWLLENPPSWYRDNYPKELTEIKNTVYRQTYDQIEYATDDEEAECTREFGEAQWDNGYMFPRAEIISEIVKELNSPWLFDLGCSHGNLPLGLIKSGHLFTYKGVGMNHRIQQKVKEWCGARWRDEPLKDQPTILYCSEVIEHCFRPEDIIHTAKKTGIDFDVILLSVPLHTLGGGLPDWRSRRLGHVRTWSPIEFINYASCYFPGYKWELTPAFSMVLVGRKA